jgi:lipoprotein-anchoring transpeptidase ErfK/SrfK
MRFRFPALLVCLLALAALVVGCGDDDQRPSVAKDKGKTEPVERPDIEISPNIPLGTSSSTIAAATAPEVNVFDAPEAPSPSHTFPNPWNLNNDPGQPTVPLVFLVEEQRDDGWIRVLLPVRPNGSTGWIRASDVELTATPYRVTIELSARRITVYEGEDVVLQEAAAVGKPETPTPPGKYYIRVLIDSIDPNSVYGPFAYGLSGFSDTLTSFNGGDAELGIHGNNDASVLGKSVTAGCTRISNESITRLTEILPLGTPVEILP